MKDLLIIGLCVVVGAAFLVGASMRLEPISKSREEMGLVANASLENAPPSLAFATIAMGAFRGIVVDILWMRADDLKQEGKFFDAKQLADWITMLQPRFAKVWDFQAWNMAYNISVAVPNTQPDERWRWVRNGYELLRDKGIEKNPKSILLYRSLAWIFQHKIGGVSDDAHKYYQRELALAMRPLLGDNTNAYFEKLSKAPKTLQDVLADEKVRAFVEALRDSDEIFKDDKKMVAEYLLLRKSPEQFKQPTIDVMDAYKGTAELAAFDVFANAYQLRNEWKFDIDFMVGMNKKYGPVSLADPNERVPLNWEHPAAHAMYWGGLGLEVAGNKEQYSVDEKNTDRIVYHSLQQLYRTGKVMLYEVPGEKPSIFVRPDLFMFKSCDEMWRDAIEKYKAFEKGNPKGVYHGHKNFLENAVLSFYEAGHEQMAVYVYNELRELYLRDEFGRIVDEYNVPMMTFLSTRLKDEFDGITPKDATEAIIFTLREAYFRYAMHDDNQAAGKENYAKYVYDLYQKEAVQGQTKAEAERMTFPPFATMRYYGLLDFLSDPVYPNEMKQSLISRIKLERPELSDLLDKQDQERIRQQKELQKQQEQNP